MSTCRASSGACLVHISDSGLHRRHTAVVDSSPLDIRLPRHLYIAVTQDRLDYDVGYAKSMQIGSESSAECVPAVPLHSDCLQCRLDHFTRDVLNRNRPPKHRLEQERFRAELQKVLFNYFREWSDHGNRPGSMLSLWRADVFSPNATPNDQYVWPS